MQIDKDTALVFHILLHLAQEQPEDGSTAREMADGLGVGIFCVIGKARMLERDGVLAVNREGQACRYKLAVPAAEVDLRIVAASIGGSLRPSEEDWRATSLNSRNASPGEEYGQVEFKQGSEPLQGPNSCTYFSPF